MEADLSLLLFPVVVLKYPFCNAATLIQIGHEPLPSIPTKNLWGERVHALPNVLQYAAHVARVDGMFGSYRGFNAALLRDTTRTAVRTWVRDWLQQDKNESKTSLFLRGAIARTAGIIIAQPFNVIALRTIAQFVGDEVKYGGLFGSVAEVYRDGGIAGFFAGLAPLLLFELGSNCLATLLVLAARRCFGAGDATAQRFAPIACQMVASFAFLPLQTVANTMAVNACGLAAGVPTYSSWLDCWRHLASKKQLTRGNWMFFRTAPHAKHGLIDLLL